MNESNLKTNKVVIIIPAFNESETIGNCVNIMLNYGDVFVIDDGSTDETGCIAQLAGALVITHETNKGYDQALVSGLSRALLEEFEIAVTIDADGQHDPSMINYMIQEIYSGADVVVGVRDRFQRYSEAIFACGAKALWGISDPLCGLKAYKLSELKSIGALYTYASIGTELIIRASISNLNIKEVPVLTRAREGRSRFGSGIRANWLIIRAMFLGVLYSYMSFKAPSR